MSEEGTKIAVPPFFTVRSDLLTLIIVAVYKRTQFFINIKLHTNKKQLY